MSKELSGPYSVNIPALADGADIEEAFTVFHYGSTAIPETEEDIVENSLTYHLKDLQTQIDGIVTLEISALTSGANLDSFVLTGFYYATAAISTSGSNFPVSGSNGLLTVITGDSTVYQTYQSISPAGLYWRSKTGSSAFSPWSQTSDTTHEHDSRYYRQNDLDVLFSGKQGTISGAATSITTSNLSSNKAVVSDASGKIAASSVTSAEIDKLSGIASITGSSSLYTFLNSLNTSLNAVSAKLPNNQKIFVQSQMPTTGMTTGDLWFW